MEELEDNYCVWCKGRVPVKKEIKEKPFKRILWKCIHCNHILAIKGIKEEE